MNIEQKKEFNELMHQAEQKSKPKYCVICGKEQTSFCNSHSVPQFVLKTIAEKGMLLQTDYLLFEDSLPSKKGVNNTGTFQIICRECDNHIFSDYESVDKIQKKPTNKMLAEIALKNSLFHLARSMKETAFTHIIQEKRDIYINPEEIYTEEALNQRDFRLFCRRYLDIIEKKHSKGFEVIYHNILPYETAFAIQNAITLERSISGKLISKASISRPDEIISQIHLCVFPVKEKTVVLLYYHKDDRKLVPFAEEFRRIPEKEKLHYIAYLIVKYSVDYYSTPSLRKLFDKYPNIKKLANEKDGLPNLGFCDKKMIEEYEPVKLEEIPDFLSLKFSLNEIDHLLAQE